MKNFYEELDGKTNGICVFLKESNKFLRNKDHSLRLYRSIELAKADLAHLGYCNPKSYKFSIFLGEEKDPIDLDYTSFIDGYFQFYTKEGKYYVQEAMKEKVIRLGYIVFNNGDQKCSDKHQAREYTRDLFNAVKSIISEIAYYQTKIEKIYKDDYSLVCKLKNSSARIHICYNNKIIDLNQKRKDDGIRCLPYDKSKDFYQTIYVYCTKDLHEPDYHKPEEIVNATVDQIMEYLKEDIPEACPHFSDVEFKGNITL